MGDELDEIKTFIDQIANVKRISYDKYNRVPDKFLPSLAEEFGIKLILEWLLIVIFKNI